LGRDAERQEEVMDTNWLAFIVDDEEGLCKFIATTLANRQIDADSFRTAEQALAALDHRIPAIIFLDIALKHSDAVDVIRGLRERKYAGAVQLMSGSDPMLLADVCRIGARHGLDMLRPLSKPFRTAAILDALTGASIGGRMSKVPPAMAIRRQDLDQALAAGWLELWYQPKIDLRTMAVVGAEGLIRCRHPEHGILMPASLLPGASEAGLRALTEFVIVQALRDWSDFANGGFSPRLAVNSTLGGLLNPNLIPLIREHKPSIDWWPGLILEVTEEDVVEDMTLAHEIATQLRIYGVMLAIDDFGEGYSSFARLRELAFAELKLDGSFVRCCGEDKRNAGICRAIIELAHQFGATAVAEGIEDDADMLAVQRMGCDIGQGFLLSPPMPKSKFESLNHHFAGRVNAS
jgi:EAL domain-containing protein (putative c-di-GMP-specific phosphodiesterase class I)